MAISDQLIWNKIQQGNQEAFSLVFIDQYDDLFRYAKRFEKDEAIIKDLIQDLFANIWQKRKKLSSVDNIKAYLYKSLRNQILNHHNSKRLQIVSGNLSETDFLFYTDDFNQEEPFEQQRKKDLIQAINELPARQREVIYLKYFQGFDTEEISMILNQNNQSVRNNLHRAISKLRQNMVLDVFVAAVGVVECL